MRFLLSLILTVGFFIIPTVGTTATITEVLLSNVLNPPPSGNPSVLTTLCDASNTCPMVSGFSFTDSERFWGRKDTTTNGGCITSTTGGVTGSWVACTTQPFTTTPSGYFTGASDGSVIAVNFVSPNCTIKRSVDNGSNWSTVFTAANPCPISGNAGQHLFCLANGNCEFSTIDFNDFVTSIMRTYRSSDNGQNWGATTVSGTFLSMAGGMAGIAWDGSLGMFAALDSSGGSIKNFSASGDAWTQSGTAWTGSDTCAGPVIYNSSSRVVCSDGTNYRLRDVAGTVITTPLTLPGSSVAKNTGGIAYSTSTGVMYITAQLASTAHATWMSTDGLATFTSLGAWGGANTTLQTGNAFFANSCVYFSTSSIGGTGFKFAKVC